MRAPAMVIFDPLKQRSMIKKKNYSNYGNAA